MPASFNPPNGQVFPQQSLIPNPVPFTAPPKEGPKSVTAAIQWSTDATVAPDQAVSFDLSNLKQQSLFSQIVAIYVDNQSCGSDITFYFPDTQSTFTVGAQTAGYYICLTNDVKFLVKHLNTLPGGDITRIEILNSFFTGTFQPVFQRVNIGNNNAAPVPVKLINGADAQPLTLNGDTLVVHQDSVTVQPMTFVNALQSTTATATANLYSGAAKTLVGARAVVVSLWNGAAQTEINCDFLVNGSVFAQVYFDMAANERFSNSFAELPIPQCPLNIGGVTSVQIRNTILVGGMNDGHIQGTALLA